jgi:cytochrome c-type biogenesis protein CcmH/NrfG
LGRYEESAGAYESALRQTPGERDALLGLAQALLALRKYDAAESNLLSIVNQSPTDVAIWLRLGDVAMLSGDEIGARDYYTRAVTERPEESAIADRARARLRDLPSLRTQRTDPLSP